MSRAAEPVDQRRGDGRVLPKLYFAAAVRAAVPNGPDYADIIRRVARLGVVLTEHLVDPVASEAGLTDVQIFDRDVAWLREADAVIAEVTVPSLGVGYELGRADALGLPILCLCQRGSRSRASAMLTGNARMSVLPYQTPSDAVEIAREWLARVWEECPVADGGAGRG
jgi:nucleoside 2-deoxyribosyltransferase